MNSAILALLFALLAASSSFALDGDILRYAKEHPATEYDDKGKLLKYGDSALIEAEEALRDIPRPWTVDKILSIYKRETDAYRRKYQETRGKNNEAIDDSLERDEERCGHLATVLAASRDPKALVALSAGLQYSNHQPAAVTIHRALWVWLLLDYGKNSPYGVMPPARKASMGRTYFETMQEVETWWTLNEKQIRRDARADPR